MYNTSNPTFREFRLIIVWKLLDDYVSEKEHPLLVKNYINPQYRVANIQIIYIFKDANIDTELLQDLILAIKEILPHTTRDQYTLYCRYKGSDLFQINDYISMITAFRIMEAHDSPLLYLIRKGKKTVEPFHQKILANKSSMCRFINVQTSANGLRLKRTRRKIQAMRK